MRLAAGQMLSFYKILEPLGAGGMGEARVSLTGQVEAMAAAEEPARSIRTLAVCVVGVGWRARRDRS